MKLKDYINELNQNKKEDIDINGKDLSIKEIEDNLKAIDNNTTKIRYVARKIADNINVNDYDQIINELNNDPENVKISILTDVRSKFVNNGTEIPSIFGMSYSKANEIMGEYLKSKEGIEYYNNACKTHISSNFNMNLLDTYGKIEKYIDNEKEKEISNDCIEHDKLLDDPKRKRDYVITLEKETNDLIKETTSSKLKDALEYAKENVLKTRNEDDLAFDAKLAEDTIRNKKNIVNIKNASKVEKDEYFNKYLEYDSGTYMFKHGVTSFGDTNKLNTELSKHEIKLSENTKNILKTAIEKLDQMKDYKTGDSLLNMNEYKSEEGTKRYAFKNILDINLDIQEAIQNKDNEKIIDLTNKHKDMTNKMDSVISDLSKLNPTNYSANISISRNQDAPIKYAEDYKSTSLVNGMWHLLALSKASGISVDDILDKPVESIIKFTEDNKNLTEIEELGKNGDIDFINKVTDSKTINGIRKNFVNKYNNFRSFEFLSTVDDKNLEENTIAFQYIKQAKFVSFFTDKNASLTAFQSKLNTTAFKNILLNQDKERKYEDIINNGVDINNIDPDKFIMKATSFKEACDNKLFNSKESQIMDAIKLASHDVALNKNSIKSENFTKICEMANINSYKVIREYAKTKDIAPFIKNEFNNVAKDGINKDNITISSNMFKAINDQYKNRGFFGKYFRSEGRAEGKLLKEFRESFNKAGIDNTNIDKMLNNEISTKEFKNHLIDKEQKIESSVKHIEINDNELENNINNNDIQIDKNKVNNLDKSIEQENIL